MLGAVTPTHQLSPQLPRKCPSVGQQRRQWARDVPIQKLLAKPQMKRGCCNFSPKSVRHQHCWRKEIKHLVPVQGSCLRKPGRKEHRQPMFGPEARFAEGVLWDGAASLHSRPFWAVAWAEPGTGLGPTGGRERRGEKEMPYVTISLLTVLSLPGASRWMLRDSAVSRTIQNTPSLFKN